MNSLEDTYGQFSLIGGVKFDFLAEIWNSIMSDFAL